MKKAAVRLARSLEKAHSQEARPAQWSTRKIYAR